MTEMFWELERRRGEAARHYENSARLAQEYHKVDSIGVGYVEIEDCLEFEITFIEEPYMHYGAEMDLDEFAELLDIDPGVTPPIPLVTGVVTEWNQDDRGFYTGAWVAVRVHFFPEDAVNAATLLEAEWAMTHHFTFTAIGMKDVPLERDL